jgi:hypothetical protein
MASSAPVLGAPPAVVQPHEPSVAAALSSGATTAASFAIEPPLDVEPPTPEAASAAAPASAIAPPGFQKLPLIVRR